MAFNIEEAFCNVSGSMFLSSIYLIIYSSTNIYKYVNMNPAEFRRGWLMSAIAFEMNKSDWNLYIWNKY